MKISKKYPQFADKKALIIVCGGQSAKMLSAKDGFIEKLSDFKIENPKYSDKEGFFQTRTKGVGVIKSGAVYEGEKEKVEKDFFREFKKNLKNISRSNKNSAIHLFSPDYLKNKVKKAVNDIFKGNVVHSYSGNFYYEDYFEVLERIKETQFLSKEPEKREAKKILNKAKKARKIIKGKP